MADEIFQDYRLQQFLKRSIDNLPLNMQIMLKNLRLCGSRLMDGGLGYQRGAFLLSDGEKVKWFGTATCKNRWACPVCTAKVMARTADDIAAAIEGCREIGLAATMITFTIPHTRSMKLWHLLEILNSAWQNFQHRSRNQTSAMAKFKNACDVQHHVKVAEVTFGDSGWHPHYHCLFWVPKDNLQKVGEFEKSLQERWRLATKTAMKNFYEKNPAESAQFVKKMTVSDYVEDIFSRADWMAHPGVHVSRTKSGKVREELSSSYISGWGSDKEMTNNGGLKVAAKGHFTPQQLLLMARDNKDEYAFYKYIEFCIDIARKRTRRVSWSIHSGIKKIIREWKERNGSTLAVKKNCNPTKMHVVCWFTSEQWQRLCDKNKIGERQVIPDIMQLARLPNAFVLITKYLADLNILPHSPCENISTKLVESIFEVA